MDRVLTETFRHLLVSGVMLWLRWGSHFMTWNGFHKYCRVVVCTCMYVDDVIAMEGFYRGFSGSSHLIVCVVFPGWC